MPEPALADLQAKPDRELDAMLAMRVGYGATGVRFNRNNTEPVEIYGLAFGSNCATEEISKRGCDLSRCNVDRVPHYCSSESRRALLDGVEAEIERRDLRAYYMDAILDQIGQAVGFWATHRECLTFNPDYTRKIVLRKAEGEGK